MTLKEKVAQLFHEWKQDPEQGDVTGQYLEKFGETGFGSAYVFWAGDRNRLQREILERSRLGIPVSFVTEALHGGGNGGTIFPMPGVMTSSWNPELFQKICSHIAREARLCGANQSMSPNMDVATDPRFGRVDEGFGEDPLLSSIFAAAAVRGLQGDGPAIDQDHIAATIKHFAAYAACENGQDGGSADLSEQRLREIYLPPFKAAIDAGAKCLMPAHQEINGVPCHGNRWLLRDLLRDEWGFEGMVLSDAGDVNILCAFGLAKDYEDAGVQGMKAGVDQELYVSAYLHLESAVEKGLLDEALIDEAVERVLSFKFDCGLFEHPYAPEVDEITLDPPEGRKQAYRAAVEGAVLLKNDGLLPLNVKSLSKVALIGPNADHVENQQGMYTRPGAHTVTLAEGLRNRLPDQVELRIAEGCHIMDEDTSLEAEALELAQWADVVLLALGDCLDSCRECYGSRPGDRTDLGLAGGQQRLLEKVTAIQSNTALILINGRPHAIPEAEAQVKAVLQAGRCGEEGGNAVADLLLGEANPSGRLVMTVPRHVGQLPIYYHRKRRGFQNRRYTFESPEPLHPFGFGLSYTSFDWSGFSVSPETLLSEDRITARMTLTNTGTRAGAEVVQLYLRDPLASISRPLRQLVAFQKVHLESGESREVVLEVRKEQFGYHNRDMTFVIDEGVNELTFARHADDTQHVAELIIGRDDQQDKQAEQESDRMLIPD
jgi:beta-glucosidase